MSNLGWLMFNNTHGSDLFNMAVVLIVTFLLRPSVGRLPFFAADRNRWPIVPMLIGLPIGLLAEYARFSAQGNFFPSVGIRRAMAAGCGAAVVLLLARVFFHRPGSTYRMNPVPRH